MIDPADARLGPRVRILGMLGMACLAVAGNVVGVPLFFGVDIIFGSVFAMLAVPIIGTGPAVLIAAAGGAYTLALWDHPYALVIFTCEALTVGLLYRRGLRNLVLADLAFWTAIGVPLVLLFYRGAIGMALEPTALIAFKQPLNGVFNALIAGLLITAMRVSKKVGPALRLDLPRVGDLVFHALLSSILLAGAVPLLLESYRLRNQNERFVAERLNHGADMVRGYLKQAGTAESASWREAAVDAISARGITVSVYGEDGNRIDRFGDTVTTSDRPVKPREGEPQGLSIWLPDADMAAMQRWKAGRYRLELTVPEMPGVSRLVVEQAAGPLVRKLEGSRLLLFFALTILLVCGVVVARVVSRVLTQPLSELDRLSGGLTAMIAEGMRPTLPTRSAREYASLANTLEDMSVHLADAFAELRRHKSSLEQQVRERTAELERLSRVASETTNGVVITDLDGRVEWINEGFTRISGYHLEEIKGRKPGSFLQGEGSHSATIDRIRTALSRLEPFEADLVNYTKTGERYWININCSPLRNTDGEIEGFLAIQSDITKRKLAERDLNRFKSTLDRTLDCVFMFDAEELKFFYVNQGGLEQVGYSQDELLSMRAYDIKPDVSEDRFRELIAPLLAGEQQSLTFEAVHQHKGGERVPVEVFLQYLASDQEEKARFVAIVRDITERKQAETALREEAAHSQSILDNMVDGLITIDQSGIVHTFSPAAEQIFGYSSQEVTGRNVRMLMPAPDRDAHDTYLRNYQETGVARIIGNGREVEGRRKDGTLFPMDLGVSDVTRDGKRMYVGLVRDVTERKRMERMKNEFVSTVSHELRTPLTSISGSLRLISGGAAGQISDKAAEMIQIAQKNSQRLTALIDDLLDIDKLVAGKMRFEMTPQPLLPLVEQAIESVRAYGTERDVTLKLTAPADALADAPADAPGVAVEVDGQRLIQVLANLLSNAVKYSPKGGVVEVAVETRAATVRVSVTDRGPGIPAALRDRIFEKFAQADSSDSRRKGGTGLGLAITRELLKRMGGWIDYRSHEGHGTEFFFDLPLVEAGSDDGTGGAELPAPRRALTR